MPKLDEEQPQAISCRKAKQLDPNRQLHPVEPVQSAGLS
jgi:hypothetical protein